MRGDRPEKSYGGGANDQLAARGELGQQLARVVEQGGVRVETGLRVTHVTESKESCGSVRVPHAARHVLADELVVATGFRRSVLPARAADGAGPALECPPALGR